MHLRTTSDGSHTVCIGDNNISYHSLHGAIAESKHVYIDAGLRPLLTSRKTLSVFEMGFGTGLCALLTMIEADRAGIPVDYETIENEPVPFELARELNYCAVLGEPEYGDNFLDLHRMEWNRKIQISKNFNFIKRKENFLETELRGSYDLIYFDAFDPGSQPGMWSAEVFRKIFNAMADNAVLVTYCSKTVVRKAMKEAGLLVEKIPGPHGKREIVRAFRQSINDHDVQRGKV